MEIDDFPNLKKWEEMMMKRDGVERGRNVPSPHTIKEMMKDKEAVEHHAAQTRAWVQQGMKADAEKK